MAQRRIRAARLIDYIRRGLHGTGTGSGSSYAEDLRKVFAYSCGKNDCYPGTRYGRGVHSTYYSKQIAYAAEACAYPPGYLPDWVHRDIWPPPNGGAGISKLLRLRVTQTETCPALHCSEALTEYDGTGWTWTLGDVQIRMTVGSQDSGTGSGSGTGTDLGTGSGDEPVRLIFTILEGSCPISFVNQPAVVCNFPLIVNLELSPDSTLCCGCCPNTTARIYVQVEGFCGNIRAARLIDYKLAPDGSLKKVFAYADCKNEFECPGLDCCVDFNCTLTACFMATSSGCACLDGVCFNLSPTIFASQQLWTNELTPFGACGCQWAASLRCTGTVNGLSTFEWNVTTNGRNCNTPLLTFTATQICTKSFDIEFPFTVECPTCDPSPPAPNPPCCDCGSYGYIARITRANCPL